MGPESNLRYERVFEDAFDPIAILADGLSPRLNRAARELPGIDVVRLLSKSGGLGPFLDELEANKRASTILRVTGSLTQARRFDVDGRVYGKDRVITLRDVTDADDREAELSHLRRVEAIGLLTASVAHDFNNLLTPIVCLSALLGRELEEGSQAMAMAKEIRVAAEQAAGLARQVLGSARRSPSQPERVDVNAVLAEMQGLMELLVGDDIDIVLSLDDAPCEIVVIRERLEHVLFNLVANARDAMPRGGSITLRSTNVPLGESVAIAVTDTGVGMSTEVRQRAFERFFTTKEQGRGTGLGLFSAHRFATENNGRISLHSDAGEGTKIMLHLPCAPTVAPVTVEVATPAPSEMPCGTETVLVADDDGRVAAVVSDVLRELGYVVIGTAGGDEAIAKARAHDGEIHLVLADVVMQEMDGRTLVERLREITPIKRVLFMSAHSDRVLEARGLAQADHTPLRKAFTPSELARRVREVLDAPVAA
ncbi:MAG: domain S-box protein [Myxococcaceae bacterium]|nr:domain S-box protein [Myxococcaceae bacterium]